MKRYSSGLPRLLDERGYIHEVTNADGLHALASRHIVPDAATDLCRTAAASPSPAVLPR